MRFLLMALFLLVSFSFSEELQKETFEFFSLEKSKSMHDYRTKLFADFFGNDLLDFGREGTYLFYECFGVQRLFYWGHGVDKEIIVYVFPGFKKSPYKMSFAASPILCGFASDLPLKKSKKFDEIFTFWPNFGRLSASKMAVDFVEFPVGHTEQADC